MPRCVASEPENHFVKLDTSLLPCATNRTQTLSNECGYAMGSGCSTAVMRMPQNLEVMGLNSEGCTSFLSQRRVLKRVPHRVATPLGIIFLPAKSYLVQQKRLTKAIMNLFLPEVRD